MHLDSSTLLNLRPPLLETLLHLFPNEKLFLIALLNLIFDRLLEHKKSEGTLNSNSLVHQEFQVNVCYLRLMHPPEFLNTSGCQDRSFVSFEHQAWNSDLTLNLLLVSETTKQFFLGWLIADVDITEAKCCNLPTVNVRHIHLAGLEHLLQKHQDVGNLAPFTKESTFEGNKLRSLVQEFPFANDQLM